MLMVAPNSAIGQGARPTANRQIKRRGLLVVEPHKLALLEQLFSNDKATRDKAMAEIEAMGKPLFDSDSELILALAMLDKNKKKGVTK